MAGRAGALSPACAPQVPQPAPAPARPSAPLCSRAREGTQLTPPCRGRGSGRVQGLHRGSTRPSGPRGERSRGISLSRGQTLGASRSSLSPPPPRPLLLSCLSALFSGLITFHIKAEPSPGCEYNAPPSPLGEERGAGAQRGGRGRGRARRAALRRRGGRPGGGPQPSLRRLPRRRWHSGRGGRPCLGRRAPGSRCPQREKSRGPKASSKERGEPQHGLQLYPHFFFPKPHPATSAGPPLDPEHLTFWSCRFRYRIRVKRGSADSPGLS